MAYLVLQLKDFETRNYEITSPVTKIGRRPSNDVPLSDPFVSRDHAEIVSLEDGDFELRDLGGENPVQVNGRIISQHGSGLPGC
jgi:pSer/pThr/pTyr-binding forkhead associated (FHA) protein